MYQFTAANTNYLTVDQLAALNGALPVLVQAFPSRHDTELCNQLYNVWTPSAAADELVAAVVALYAGVQVTA